jgi:hypothetical protein
MASAAAPEVGRCVAQAGGKYKDANCVEKTLTGKGQFEFTRNALRKNFTGSGGESVWEAVAGGKIVCDAVSESGEYLEKGAAPYTREVRHVLLVFRGCKIPSLQTGCESAGAAEGEIKTYSLHGPLGYISGEKTTTPVVGLMLSPETPKGLTSEFYCLNGGIHERQKGVEGTVEGRKGGNCVIASILPANMMSTTFSMAYAGKSGQQEPQHFQPPKAKFCNLEDNSNGGAYERFTWTFDLALTNEEALEIKA